MPFKFESKEMYPIFVFANFWSIHSKVVKLGKNAHSKYCIVLSNVVTPTRKSLEFKHASQ